MKITDISIRIEPSIGEEETIKPVTLVRLNKGWSAIQDDGKIRSLFSGEIRVIHMINNEIISKFNIKKDDKK